MKIRTKIAISLFYVLVCGYILIFIMLCNINLSKIFISHINLIVISKSLTIFSCFYDKRIYSLRLIGVASFVVNFSCSFKLYNVIYQCEVNFIRFKKDSSGYKYNRSYINIIISLYNYSYFPSKININNVYYDVIYNRLGRKRNVLCITTLKNFNSYNLLTESLKIYRHYGISDVYIYSSDIDIDLDKLIGINGLKYHLIYIHNEYFFYNTFYFGQIVKYNDCLYRNMYTSNYITFTDYDEIIVLYKWSRFEELIKKNPIGDIYYFKSALCPTNNTIQEKQFTILNDINLNQTLNCCMMNLFYHSKYLISTPYKFLKINIHYIDYLYEKTKSIFVNEDEGYIHHSRIPTYKLMNHCSYWFYENSFANLLQIT